MKSILFIGVTKFNLNEDSRNLEKKYRPLSEKFNVFVLARGKAFGREKFGARFYLIGNRIFYIPFAFLAGSFLCVFKGVDTIICQGPLTEGLIGSVLKIIFRKKLIVEIHGDWLEWPFINKKRILAPTLKKLVPIAASFSFSRSDKIRGVAEYFIKDLRNKYPNKKYFIFPTYSDLSIYLSEEKARFKRYICTVAVLSPIKNIETLIEALHKVRKRAPEFKLVIVGDGPSRGGLGQLVNKLSLLDSVIFTGKLSSNETKDVMKDCYVFALPSLSEGLPRVILEAMALGKPVISSNVGGVPEVIKEG